MENRNIKQKPFKPISAPYSVEQNFVNKFIEEVETSINQGENKVIIDCSSLTRVTSSHINSLWLAYEICQDNKSELILENVNDGLKRVIEALDLSEIFLKEPSTQDNLILKIQPTVDNIDLGMSKIINYLLSSGLTEVATFEIQTIFYEIATNIRLHSGIREDQSFTVVLKVEKQQVTLTFTDQGIAFDPTSRDNNCNFRDAGQKFQHRGFGLAMVSGLCHSISYSRIDDKKNQLVIKKRW